MDDEKLIEMIKEVNATLEKLYGKRARKDDLRIARLQTELASISRETNAYYDGAFDMAKRIEEVLETRENDEKAKSAIGQV